MEYKTAKANSVYLAGHLIAAQQPMVQCKNILFLFNGKFYDPVSPEDLDKMVYKFLEKEDMTDLWKTGRLTEIKRAIMANEQSVPVIEQMDSQPGVLCLNNGILNIKNRTLHHHDPSFYFTSCVDVDFDKNMKLAPRFVKFMETMFTDENGQVDNDTIVNLLRIGGYLLYPGVKIPKMFLFLGEGANGKSLLMETYQLFFHSKNISYLTLEQLSSDHFIRSRLLGSRINISTEAKGSEVNAEEIKKIISGEGITVNKKYAEPIEFFPITKILIASNTRPYFNDTTHGIDRRLYIVAFKNRFVDRVAMAGMTDKAARQQRIFLAEDHDELLAAIKSEKSAILNMFLTALEDLETNCKWALPESVNSQETREEYKAGSDIVGHFLKEHYEAHDNQFGVEYSADEILAHYRQWYRENVKDMPLNYSSIAMAKKIKDQFRIDSVQKKVKDMVGNTSAKRMFKLQQKPDDQLERNFSSAEEVGGPVQKSLLETDPRDPYGENTGLVLDSPIEA